MLNMADSNGKPTEITTCLEVANSLDQVEKLQAHENEVWTSYYEVEIMIIVKCLLRTSTELAV